MVAKTAAQKAADKAEKKAQKAVGQTVAVAYIALKEIGGLAIGDEVDVSEWTPEQIEAELAAGTIEPKEVAPVPKAPKMSSKPSVYEPHVMDQIASLEKAGVELDGSESPEFIDTLYQDQMLSNRDTESVQENRPGIPNMLPPRSEKIVLGGKERAFPCWFIAAVKGGFCLYNEIGQRVTDVAGDAGEIAKINKQLAKINAERRAGALPTDFK